jgi:prepilin-type N-terminal cleavage/methylation domain-containing protein
MISDTWHVTGDKKPVAARELPSCHVSRVTRRAFTLIELLVVISIMGLLAALAVPALKNLGKSNIQASASRQLLDDIGRARQLAIAQHTTVYMVFVPTNFFTLVNYNNQNFLTGLNAMTPASNQLAALTAMTNLVDKQLTGYNFISRGRVGDQPGQHAWHYLEDWKNLPDGTFIAAAKFLPQTYSTAYSAWQADYGSQIDTWFRVGGTLYPQIIGFTNSYANYIPFPTDQSPGAPLPFIAFDYTGRLISEFDGVNYHHAYIPLAQGTVSYGVDVNKHLQPTVVKPTDITEIPAGNSASISYNVIDVDPLSGRAKLLVHQIP